MSPDRTGWRSLARLPPDRMEACEAWTKAGPTTEAEGGSGGEVTAEAKDAAGSLEEAAATPTTDFLLKHVCSVSYFLFFL